MKHPIIGFTTLLTATLIMTSVVYADEQADKQASADFRAWQQAEKQAITEAERAEKQAITEAERAINAAVEPKDVNQVFADYARQQPSQANRQNLTAAEQQSLQEMKARNHERMLRNVERQQNMFNCMNGLGSNCGYGPITP
jgi:hypothetical protein